MSSSDSDSSGTSSGSDFEHYVIEKARQEPHRMQSQDVTVLRIPKDGSSPVPESVQVFKTNTEYGSTKRTRDCRLDYIPDVHDFWEGGDFEKRKIVMLVWGGIKWHLLFSQDPALGAHTGIEPADYLFGDAFFFRVLYDVGGRHVGFKVMGEKKWPFLGDKARKVMQMVAND